MKFSGFPNLETLGNELLFSLIANYVDHLQNAGLHN